MILQRCVPSACWGSLGWGRGSWGGDLRLYGGIPPKGILLVNRAKSASHSIHSGTTLTRHHCCCGDNNGIGRDPVAPLVVVASLVFVGTCSGGNTIYACFDWLISHRWWISIPLGEMLNSTPPHPLSLTSPLPNTAAKWGDHHVEEATRRGTTRKGSMPEKE